MFGTGRRRPLRDHRGRDHRLLARSSESTCGRLGSSSRASSARRTRSTPSTTDALEEIRGITGAGANFTVETSGVTSVLRTAVDSLAPVGVCGVIGAPPGGAEVGLDVNMFFALGKTLRGIVEGDSVPELFLPRLFELWRAGRFPVDRFMVTTTSTRSTRPPKMPSSGNTIKPVLRMSWPGPPSGRPGSTGRWKTPSRPDPTTSTRSSSARASPGSTRSTGCAHGLKVARLRGGAEGRRHLVLEPLPGRTLRCRQHGLLLLVLRGAAAGMDLERALSGPAGAPAIPYTSPTASTCAPTSSSRPGSTAAIFDEARAAGASPTEAGERFRARFCVMATGLPVHCPDARFPGLESFEGGVYHTVRLAAGGRRFHGQAGRRDRHRLERGPARSRVIAEQAAPVTVFQRTPNFSVPSRNGR